MRQVVVQPISTILHFGLDNAALKSDPNVQFQ